MNDQLILLFVFGGVAVYGVVGGVVAGLFDRFITGPDTPGGWVAGLFWPFVLFACVVVAVVLAVVFVLGTIYRYFRGDE